MLLAGGGERSRGEILQSILFFTTEAVLKGNYVSEPKLLGVYRSLMDLGKGNTQLQPSLVMLSHLSGVVVGGGTEKP